MIAFFIAFFLLTQERAVAAEQPVTEAVGVVDGKTITSREVALSYYIDQLVFTDGAANSKLEAFKPSQMEGHAESLLMEVAVATEAKGFDVGKVEAEQAESLTQRFIGRLRELPTHQDLPFRANEIKQAIERKVRARRFLDFKKASIIVLVSDSEAREYFRKNRVKFGSVAFSRFKSNIKRFLKNQKMGQRLRQWFDMLRRKYTIRNFAEENRQFAELNKPGS